MPEGDIVWFTARRLHAALAGRPLTVSDFRVPRYATVDLRGRRVDEVVSRGKHLLIRVDGGLTVHSHLKMDGSWRITPAGRRGPEGHRVRLVLANDRWRAAGLSLGEVQLLRTAAEDRVVGHLGPDLLGPDWDRHEAARLLAEHPRRPIGEALLDQSRLAGIGNLYKAEVLFLREVHPWTPAGDVPDLGELVELARRLLDRNKEHPEQITTTDHFGSAARGRPRTWVYGRAGRPCLRCGTPVERADQGPGTRVRVTFWCPHCQPAPPAGPPPADPDG